MKTTPDCCKKACIVSHTEYDLTNKKTEQVFITVENKIFRILNYEIQKTYVYFKKDDYGNYYSLLNFIFKTKLFSYFKARKFAGNSGGK